jgi:hypothetical protein
MGGSGLQYLVASNMHLLSDAIYRGFEVPLLHEVDSYKEKNAENEERYKKQASEKTRELHKRETQHLKLARQKKRSTLLPMFWTANSPNHAGRSIIVSGDSFRSYCQN